MQQIQIRIQNNFKRYVNDYNNYHPKFDFRIETKKQSQQFLWYILLIKYKNHIHTT